MSINISVIVPVYNVAKYLEKCVESIENQTYQDFEIILIDDGSSDGSEIICDELKEKYKNISVIHQSNSGVSSARNKGIDSAKGNYILFIDSDDNIETVMLEKLANAQKNYPNHIPVCGIRKVFPDFEKNCVVDASPFFLLNKKDFFVIQSAQMFNGPVNKLYSKKILDEKALRFNPDIRIGEDMIFNADYVIKSDLDFAVVNEALYNYNVFVTESISKKYIPDIFHDYLEMDKKFRELFEYTKTDLNLYESRYSTILLYGIVHSIQNTISSKNTDSIYKKIKYIKRILYSFSIKEIVSKADTGPYSNIYIKILCTRNAGLIYAFRTIKK